MKHKNKNNNNNNNNNGGYPLGFFTFTTLKKNKILGNCTSNQSII